MVVLVLTLLISFLLPQNAAADLRIICIPTDKCGDIQKKIGTQTEEATKDTSLVTIRSLGLDKSIKFLQLIGREGNDLLLLIEKKPTITDVSFKEVKDSKDVDVDRLQRISQLQEGVHYNPAEVEEARVRIQDWLSDRGYVNPIVKVDLQEESRGEVRLKVSIDYSNKLTLDKIEIKGEQNSLLNELLRPIKKLEGKPFSRVNFKLALDQVVNELRREGYFNNKVSFKEVKNGTNIRVDLDISLGDRWQFAFYGNKNVDRETLSLRLKKAIQEGTTVLRNSDLIQVVENAYKDIGLYNNKVELYYRKGFSREGSSVRSYYFNIHEGKKVRLKKLSFKGNLAIELKALKELYYSRGSVLARRDFLDENYLERFTTILKNYYLKRGFVFIDISKPRLILNDSKTEAEVIYSIKERQQSILSKVNLKGLEEKFQTKIKSSLQNQVGQPLNVLELEGDLSRAINMVREQGFYYATIENLDEDNVVTYESNYTRSQINLEFKTGKVTVFDNVVLSGNRVTKDIVLLREVKLERGDIITPEVMKGIRDRITSLGLFGNVQVLPLVTNRLSDDKVNKTNVIIQVQEKQFGRGEIAPGYRTDIGAKLSFTIQKSNLLGMNDSGTLKLQLNRRFSLSQFDQRRASNGNHRIEGIGTLNYSYPYLLGLFNFDGNLSVQRRRFFAFDADILRIAPQINRKVNDYLGLSLRYQYERIRQFDATEAKDRATFEIGSVTPGITLDFRDSPVSPRSGAYFGLNWEFANPNFGSQSDDEIEINFSKIISRNRVYWPIGGKNFVFAFSFAAGMQENYADDVVGTQEDGSPRTRGYIPSIKVFRLDGFDVVRGFADNEINRLSNGEDITKRRIQGKAFFANFKFEPRYYVDDTFVVGPFFDAGRLFVNTFRPLDLRTSAGLTFKFLTPVGTLDFDYGVKLKRKRFGNGNRESFGRFHLSIGYF